MTISLEVLGAFVDGELDEQERARIEAAIASNAALAAEVARIRQLSTIVAHSYDGLLAVPVPAALTKAAQADVPGKVVQLTRQRVAIDWQGALAGASAMAAAFAFAMYSGVLQSPPSLIEASHGELVAGERLSDGLDRTASAVPFAVERGQAHISLSFVAASGRPCRQFHAETTEHALDGVACRAGERWHIEVLAASQGRTAGGYHVAGAASGVIDAGIDRMKPVQVLDSAAERSAIARAWKDETGSR